MCEQQLLRRDCAIVHAYAGLNIKSLYAYQVFTKPQSLTNLISTIAQLVDCRTENVADSNLLGGAVLRPGTLFRHCLVLIQSRITSTNE